MFKIILNYINKLVLKTMTQLSMKSAQLTGAIEWLSAIYPLMDRKQMNSHLSQGH